MATANQKAIDAACAWAIKVAADNTFHYGRSAWGHKYGCYYCGTQGAKKKAAPKSQKKEVEKTYCCNPFVVASWVHGAGVDSKCGVGYFTVPLANGSVKSLLKHDFVQVKKPSKKSDLKKGDVCLTVTHAMLVVEDGGKISHAAHHDNGKKGSYWNSSIVTEMMPDKQWKRIKKVFRYTGNGKFKDDPKPAAKFVVGKTYELQEDMNIRSESNARAKLVPTSEWTESARGHMTEDGLLAKGTKVTVKEIKTNGTAYWLRIPSGWICGIGGSGKVFVK